MVGLARLTTREILEQERHTGERRRGVDLLGVGSGAFVLAMDDGVERRVARFGAFDRGVHQLAGVHLVAVNEVGQRRRVEVVVLGKHQCGCRPPSTTIVWPDTNAESSDSR